MGAVARKPSKVAVLKSVLNPLLSDHGGSIGDDSVLWFGEKPDLAGILACLIVVSIQCTVVLNFAIGKCWACMDGKRSSVLRGIVGPNAFKTMQQRMMNCAVVYRRWEVPQIAPNGKMRNWQWHIDHGMDAHGTVVRRVPTVAAKNLVCEMAAKDKLSKTEKSRQEVWWAVEAMQHMEDDDTDEFAEESELQT